MNGFVHGRIFIKVILTILYEMNIVNISEYKTGLVFEKN